jgi:5-methyltetrahydrofolate--homocysteine methyltransferase
MRSTLQDLLALGRPLLADGATGTNYFQMGLSSGEPPEFWTVDHPDRVVGLHEAFVNAGADIILTNTFGCNRHRLKLHEAQARTYELARRAAELASQVAERAPRSVVVAGSVGPTGSLFEPLGELTHDEAVDTFAEQMRGLLDGGANVVWIETMSAIDEVRAACEAAISVGAPYVATCSFDTAGRTMMGLLPGDLHGVFDGLAYGPLAFGANCGVGASDILVSVSEMRGAATPIVCKGNCGVPHFQGTEIVYTGTPELMADYVALAIDTGCTIIGGCCGTSPQHLVAMRDALDNYCAGSPPTVEEIVAATGPLVNSPPTAAGGARRRGRRGNDC